MNIVKEALNELNVLDETKFIRNDKFYNHYKKHTANDFKEYFFETSDELLEPMSEDEYDDNADLLSKEPVYSSDINDSHDVVGFMTKSGAIIKYRKSMSEIVIYKAKEDWAHTLTYYKIKSYPPHHRYKELLSRDYGRELTPEDDKYNQ